jgi:uncharacterized protein
MKHTKVADAIGNKVVAETGWSYVSVDPTPAPLGDVSIAAAIEDFTGAKFGSSGTFTAGPHICYCSCEGGACEADWVCGTDSADGAALGGRGFNVDSLLTCSAVCSAGLDTLSAAVSVEQMEPMFRTWPRWRSNGTSHLSARLQPIPGKKEGGRTKYDHPFLFNTTLHALP